MNSISITQKQHKDLMDGYREIYKSNTNVDVSDETLYIEVATWLDDIFKKSLTDDKVKSTLDRLNTQILNLKKNVMKKLDKKEVSLNNPAFVRGKDGGWHYNPDY